MPTALQVTALGTRSPAVSLHRFSVKPVFSLGLHGYILMETLDIQRGNTKFRQTKEVFDLCHKELFLLMINNQATNVYLSVIESDHLIY